MVLQRKFFLGRREKKDKEGSPTNWISTKSSVSLDFGMVSVFLAEDPGGFFCFLVGVPLELSGHSRFRAIFKTSDTEVNLLHVFSDGVSRDAKKIKEGGQGKGHADAASFPSRDKGEQTKRHMS